MPGLTENIDCLDEEIYGRACPSPTPSNEMDETPSSAGKNKKQTKENPKKAWSSPYLESQMANKHVRPLSTKPIHLEASGRHLSLHKQPLSNSKGDTALQQRPFTAIGLCGKKQAHGIQEASRRSVSEPKLEESTAATDDDADAYWDLQSRNLLVATGHALGKVKVATAPEKLAKHTQHHYLPEEGRPKADGPLPSNLAIAPLPVLQGGACTHFPSKRLIKVCSSAPPRTPRGFHKACSQALRRPVVNAVMNAHLH